jgi:hypothetical protein
MRGWVSEHDTVTNSILGRAHSTSQHGDCVLRISGSDERGAEPSFVNRMEDLARLTMPSRKGRVLLHQSDCSLRESVTMAQADIRAINQQVGRQQTAIIKGITVSRFIFRSSLTRTLGSSVGIATGYGFDDPGSNVGMS